MVFHLFVCLFAVFRNSHTRIVTLNFIPTRGVRSKYSQVVSFLTFSWLLPQRAFSKAEELARTQVDIKPMNNG